MRAEGAPSGSTRGPARPYHADMRTSTILIPFLFTLAAGVACKDDVPAGADFGEPCGDDPCADGMKCSLGYCEQECMSNSDCQTIPGFRHECHVPTSTCHILCSEGTLVCPTTLPVAMKCGLTWCEAVEDAS